MFMLSTKNWHSTRGTIDVAYEPVRLHYNTMMTLYFNL